MFPKPRIDVVDLLSLDRGALLDVLAGLSPDEWHAPSPCPGWSVKDVAAHILGDDLGNLAGGRDDYADPSSPNSPSWDELVAFINRRNEDWIVAARRLSPRSLVELLEFTGPRVVDHFRSLDPLTIGPPVSWAGPHPAPRWLHIAREYTERWLHQQQIREGAGRPDLTQRRFLFPVLDTFVHALPHTYRGVAGRNGDCVRFAVTGDAGGEWTLVCRDGGWGLYEDVALPPIAQVTIDQDTAWRLFTKGTDPEPARRRARLSGDVQLAAVALQAVAIIA